MKKCIILIILCILSLFIIKFYQRIYSYEEVLKIAEVKLTKFLEVYNYLDVRSVEKNLMTIAGYHDISQLPKSVKSIDINENSIIWRDESDSFIELDLLADVKFEINEGYQIYNFIISFYLPSLSKKIHKKDCEDPLNWIIGWSRKEE